jgi:hypothetical protein
MRKLIGFLAINVLVLGTSQVSNAQLLPVMPYAPPGGTQGLGATTYKCENFPNSQAFMYVLDGYQAIKGGFPFVTGGYEANNTLIIQDFSLTKPQIDGGDLIGVGVRLFVMVKKDIQNLNTVGIPWLALEAERKNLEATINLQVIGIQNPKILDKYPNITDLIFSSLVNAYQTINRIRELVCTEGTNLTPQVLAHPK